MTTDIFIRTYSKDIQWLHYALQSIHKFCTGFNEIIICIPVSQKHLLDGLTAERVVTCPDYNNDYLGQQVSKMLAYKYCSSDYIMYTDSDCIFTKPTKPEDFFIGDVPFILKTPYEKVGDAICWKEPTEAAMKGKAWHGRDVKFEFMRRLPLLYKRSTIENIDTKLFDGRINEYIMTKERFSEFNLIGAYADYYENGNYAFLNTDEVKLPDTHLKQFFSHDGVEKHLLEIKEILK